MVLPRQPDGVGLAGVTSRAAAAASNLKFGVPSTATDLELEDGSSTSIVRCGSGKPEGWPASEQADGLPDAGRRVPLPLKRIVL